VRHWQGETLLYYVHASTNSIEPNQFLGVWEVDETCARRIDVTDSELGRVKALPGKTALETLRGYNPSTTFEELELEPGEYYPGMARPIMGGSPGRNPDQSREAMSRRASASGQLHALIQQLEQICRVVHPKETNFQTYGHEIRNVLILACTELESQWKAILGAHRAPADNTKHYVKLCAAMKLADYSVEFPYYPWMPERRPFQGWQHGTKDLPWYGAYNFVKHNRDEHFSQASLDNAFEALTGFFVMLSAQYGWDFALKGDAASRAFFCLKAYPQWPLSEYYVPAYVLLDAHISKTDSNTGT
jgi:hypothetical protein